MCRAETGLIVADRYGGAIVKPAEAQTLHASRRKAVTISFAKVAAERLVRDLGNDRRNLFSQPGSSRCPMSDGQQKRVAVLRPAARPKD